MLPIWLVSRVQAQQLVLLSPAFPVEPFVNGLLLVDTRAECPFAIMTLTINHDDEI